MMVHLRRIKNERLAAIGLALSLALVFGATEAINAAKAEEAAKSVGTEVTAETAGHPVSSSDISEGLKAIVDRIC